MSNEEFVSLMSNGNSYRITIPSRMIDINGWRKGDRLKVMNDGSNIHLSRPCNTRIFSIGYEGKNIDDFVKVLKENGIEQLIDVREWPHSRKKGFSRSSLQSILGENGISYTHIPELGTDRGSRKEYRETGSITELLKRYRYRIRENIDKYDLLKALSRHRTSTLMCFEDDNLACHRQVLEEMLKKEGFEVVNLWNGNGKRSS